MTLTCKWVKDHTHTGKLVMKWTVDEAPVMTPETRNRTTESTHA